MKKVVRWVRRVVRVVFSWDFIWDWWVGVKSTFCVDEVSCPAKLERSKMRRRGVLFNVLRRGGGGEEYANFIHSPINKVF